MRIFIGYGYNDRDEWIERDAFPILQAMKPEIVSGKNMHGEVLRDGVKERIESSDGLIGFSTLRVGQEKADYGSHIWVRDEMQHALTPLAAVELHGHRETFLISFGQSICP